MTRSIDECESSCKSVLAKDGSFCTAIFLETFDIPTEI